MSFDFRDHFPFRLKIRNKIIIPFAILALASTILGVQAVSDIFSLKMNELIGEGLQRSSEEVTALLHDRLVELDRLCRVLADLEPAGRRGEPPRAALETLGGQGFRWEIRDAREGIPAGANRAGEGDRGGQWWFQEEPGGLWLAACAPLRTDAGRAICLRRRVDAAFFTRVKQETGLDLVLFGREKAALATRAVSPQAGGFHLDDFPVSGEVGQARLGERQYAYLRFPLKSVPGPAVATAVLLHPHDDILTWQRRFRWDILLAATGFSLLAVIGFVFIVRRITTPIQRLMEAADRVGRGDLATTVTVSSGDEIGRLAESFQSMTASLRRSQLELQEATQKIIHQEKLASLGQTVATIMHEVKNPLNSLLILLQLADEAVGPAERMAALGRMRDEVRRLTRAADQFLSLARGPRLALEPVNINERVRLLLGNLESLFTSHGVEIRTELDEELPVIMLDEGRLDQIIYNLALNALHAMKQGGVLTLSTATVPLPAATGNCIRIRVADTGVGIPSEQLEKVFNPFFTTKPAGEGTGLGLTIVKSVVEECGGTVRLLSRQGEGTVVEVIFPL